MGVRYRKGKLEDLKAIGSLVNQAINTMEQCKIHQWDKLYPTTKDFRQDIEKNQLIIGFIHHEIAVVYTLNQECDDEYQNGQWNCPESKFYTIHRLCVHPNFQNRGIAKITMGDIEKSVALLGADSIRLDVFSENPYALRLYEGRGYHNVGYADWRMGRFYLMEKMLK